MLGKMYAIAIFGRKLRGLKKMNALENFEKAVEILHNEAPSDKARDFLDKIAGEIRSKGQQWIEDRVYQLHITDRDVADDSSFPIEDNRAWYMKEWQKALANA